MTWLEGADRTQDFSKRYPGAAIKADKIVLHTTEGPSWPGYAGGANAPHLTILVDPRTGAVEYRQHFRLDRSSRALKNLPGGVETNTDDTIQVELIGTCDPRAVAGWAKNSLLWPTAEEKHLAGVRSVLLEVVAAVPTIPWQDAAPRGWAPYPSSYANGAGQRLTFDEWRNAHGLLGHQHVPENTHGDPGSFPIAQLLAITPTPREELDPMLYISGNNYVVLGHNGGWVSIPYTFSDSGQPKTEYENLVAKLGEPVWVNPNTLAALIADGRDTNSALVAEIQKLAAK